MSAPYDPNIYAPPPPPPTWTPTPESRVQGPAIGLLIGGALGAIFWIGRAVLSAVMMTFLGVAGMSDPQLQNDPAAMMMLSSFGIIGIAISISRSR